MLHKLSFVSSACRDCCGNGGERVLYSSANAGVSIAVTTAGCDVLQFLCKRGISHGWCQRVEVRNNERCVCSRSV